MNKLLILAVSGLLAACGNDASKGVQTYQSLADAAKSDPVSLSKQINNGVELTVNPAIFSGVISNDNYILMKSVQDSHMQVTEAFSLTFAKSDKEKIDKLPEFVAVCKNNKIEAGVGSYVFLRDCTIK